jgi:Icc-related predicted phosphoesterase
MNTKTPRIFSTLVLLVLTNFIACSKGRSQEKTASPSTPSNAESLELKVPDKFNFVALGDTRFHDPADSQPANAAIRQALVAAIDKENPAFVSIGGDVVYTGDNPKDWEVWDYETSAWREHKMKVYPALGNHDLKGDEKTALANYFARFPELHESRFYSVRMGKSLMLVLDSALEETSGLQGEWLHSQLEHLPVDLNFVFFVFHHPPYTSSSDQNKALGGGHSARSKEQVLGEYLQERQKKTRARFIVFSGHVHNYERHEHGGVTYFVTGGGGAHPYPIPHREHDLYTDGGTNYHYLLVQIDGAKANIVMNKVEIKDGKQIWTKPDSVTITAPAALPAAAD